MCGEGYAFTLLAQVEGLPSEKEGTLIGRVATEYSGVSHHPHLVKYGTPHRGKGLCDVLLVHTKLVKASLSSTETHTSSSFYSRKTRLKTRLEARTQGSCLSRLDSRLKNRLKTRLDSTRLCVFPIKFSEIQVSGLLEDSASTLTGLGRMCL